MAAWPPPKPSLDLNIKKEIDEAIKEAFSDSIIVVKIGKLNWWNLRIRFAIFLISVAAWVVGSKTDIEVEEETPRSKFGDLG